MKPDARWQIPESKTLFQLGKTRAYCVVIPVVNEGPRIRSLLEKMDALKIHEIADTIIVDGGTTDGSLDENFLTSVGVRALLLKTGPGKLSAQLRCAYAHALREDYDGIITIDGNDKDNPAAIPAFIAALKDGADFVQASRFISGGRAENTPASRDFAIRWIHAPALSFFSGFRWTDTTQGFRAYSARLLRDEKIAPFRDIFSTYELLAYLSYRAPKLGYKCVELPTERVYPKGVAIPTKISSFRGNLQVLKILFAACLGKYNP
jgi:glycosyltransferase involved in cell wall biosynthesis